MVKVKVTLSKKAKRQIKEFIDSCGVVNLKVNWELLRRQKLALLRAITDLVFLPSPGTTAKGSAKLQRNQNLLRGIVHLIDDIQDQAAETIGEKKVFGRLGRKK